MQQELVGQGRQQSEHRLERRFRCDQGLIQIQLQQHTLTSARLTLKNHQGIASGCLRPMDLPKRIPRTIGTYPCPVSFVPNPIRDTARPELLTPHIARRIDESCNTRPNQQRLWNPYRPSRSPNPERKGRLQLHRLARILAASLRDRRPMKLAFRKTGDPLQADPLFVPPLGKHPPFEIQRQSIDRPRPTVGNDKVRFDRFEFLASQGVP